MKPKNRLFKYIRVCYITIFFVLSLPLLAGEPAANKTKLILGLGISASYIPDYIGSDEATTYVIPVPFVYYKSDKFTLDRNALQGNLFENKRWHLTFDMGGSIPVDSDKNKAREGMADLDWVGEIGPSLEYYFLGNHRQQNNDFVELSIRKAVATDFSNVDDIGWTGGLSFRHRRKFDTSLFGGDVTLDSSLRFVFNSDRYAQYYYSVAEHHKTVNREKYDAKGGYAGSRVSVGGTWRKNNLWVGVFARYAELNNSSFIDSPLVKSKHNLLAGVVITYIFIDK